MSECRISILTFPKEGYWVGGDSLIYSNIFIGNAAKCQSGSVPGMGKIMVIETALVLTLLELIF